jgi:hypothetical protein
MKTFVVRIWTPDEPAFTGEDDPLHGLVEHVGSGSSTSFGNESELLAFFRAAAGTEPGPAERSKETTG